MNPSGTPIPDGIVLRRHLELRGRGREAWARRALVAVVALIPLLALSGAFGQRPSTSQAESDAAELSVYSPSRVRGGLLFTARFRVDAKRELRRAALVLDPGWVEGMQVNSITPDPVAQRSEDGRIVLELGTVPAGRKVVLFVQFQVDPTNIGRRSQDVALMEGESTLLDVQRSITVFP